MTTSQELSRAFGFLKSDEVVFLKELIALIPQNGTFINIGAGPGTSGIAAHEVRPDVRVVTVDIQPDVHPEGGLGNEREAMKAAGLWENSNHRQISGDSKVVGGEWKEDVDMVFIDGGHSYDQVVGDIEAWLPHLVTKRGILVFHDCEKQPIHWHDVFNVVQKMVEPFYPKIGHVHTTSAFRIIPLMSKKVAKSANTLTEK